MSEIMLQGILRMPPSLWTGDPLDVAQRHGRYTQAADRLEELERENATLRAALEKALPVLEEHAEEQHAFWDAEDKHGLAARAESIYTDAKAALGK